MDINEMLNEYSFLKDITKKRVDLIENEIDTDEDIKLYSKNELNFNKDNVVLFKEDNYESNNNIINQLLSSTDYSTYNMGILLSMLEKEFPNYLNNALDILSNSLSYENGVVRYTGKGFDYFSLYGTISVLKKVLVNEGNHNLGVLLLENAISSDRDEDFEFYTYLAFLRRYTGNKNQTRLEDILGALVRCYEQESTKEEALDNMRKLVILVEYTKLSFGSTNDGAYYDVLFNEVCLNNIYKADSITLHEFGHAIDNYFSPRDKRVRPNKLFEGAIKHINSNPRSLEIINEMQNKLSRIDNIASTMYDNAMKEKYGSIDGAIEMFERKVRKKIDSDKLDKYLEKLGVSEDIIDKIRDDIFYERLDVRRVAELLYKVDKANHCYMCIHQREEGAFMDIIGAIYGSRSINVQGHNIDLFMGHSKEYFASRPDNSMTEIMANLNSLFVLGRHDLLDQLKEIVGDELWDFLMKERNARRIISPKNQNKYEKKVA